MATKQKKQEKTATASGKAQGGAIAASSGGSTSKLRDLGRYFENAKTELGKVSWPTKKEVKATSIAVLILVVVMSIFLGIADLILAKIMEAILSIGL